MVSSRGNIIEYSGGKKEKWGTSSTLQVSVVKPTWLLSSNCEASLRGHERLKDWQQLKAGRKEKMKKISAGWETTFDTPAWDHRTA